MANTGWLSPTTFSSSPLGGTYNTNWTSAINAASSNNVYTTTTASHFGGGNVSNYILAQGFNVSIPTGSTVQGIEVEVEAKRGSSDSATFNRVRLIKSGTIQATDLADGTTISSSDTYYAFGGSASLWGTTFTESQVEQSSFGVAISVGMGSTGDTVSIDHIRVRVTYNPTPTISSGPTFNHNSGFTRIGPNNTPGVLTFTATHEDGGTLDYQIHTASGGTGTLVGSGTCTSGTSKTHNVAYNASGLSNGTHSLWVRAKKDSGNYGESEDVQIKVDGSSPTSVYAAPTSNPSGTTYTLSYRAVDAYSTNTNELDWEYSTSNTFSTTLATGSFTTGLTMKTSPVISDPTLTSGANVRYFRVIDGAGNYDDVGIVVTRNVIYTETSNPVAVHAQTYGIGKATYREPQGVVTARSYTLGTAGLRWVETSSQTIVVVFTGGIDSNPNEPNIFIEVDNYEILSVITAGTDVHSIVELLNPIIVNVITLSGEVYTDHSDYVPVLVQTYGIDGNTVVEFSDPIIILVQSDGTDMMEIAGIEEYRVRLYQTRNPYTVVLNIG